MTANVSKNKSDRLTGKEAELNSLLNESFPHLRKVVHLKLKRFEKEGIIPRNMYSAQEIVDDVYLSIFENFNENPENISVIKVKMYSIAREILEDLREKHAGKRLSFEKLYQHEIKELEEKFSADADGEPVMIEELDDISYHQDDYKDEILLLDTEHVDELSEELDIDNERKLTDAQKKSISKAYSKLPELSHSVINHYVFGKLSVKEISDVHQIPVETVHNIIEKVKNKFKDIL